MLLIQTGNGVEQPSQLFSLTSDFELFSSLPQFNSYINKVRTIDGFNVIICPLGRCWRIHFGPQKLSMWSSYMIWKTKLNDRNETQFNRQFQCDRTMESHMNFHWNWNARTRWWLHLNFSCCQQISMQRKKKSNCDTYKCRGRCFAIWL